jgi:transglutaminase-like putative cysteine protease
MIPTSADGRWVAALLFWLLIAAAIFIEQLADLPADAAASWPLVAALGWTAWPLVLRRLARRAVRAWSSRHRTAALAAIAAAAFAPPVAIAGWSALTAPGAVCPGLVGVSPEGLLLACFRGLLLTLLAVGLSPGETRLAAATSLFLVAVSLIVVEHPAARLGMAAYALIGTAWLVATRREASSGRERAPAGIVAAIAVSLVAAALGDPAGRSVRTISGFVPLSGGDGWAFPWARGGSGDGEDLIAAREKPTATGPVDSEIFVLGHKPSLYDLLSDLYGEPEQRTRTRTLQRAFGLGPDETVAEASHLPDSEHSGREFATARRGGSRRQPRQDLAARALVSVSGPHPVHLRLEAFEDFDGRTWRTAATASQAMAMPTFKHVGNSWMRWRERDGCEAIHEVTVGTLATPVLPLVAHTTGLRIDKIERAEFYREPQTGVVSLETMDVPAGTRLETRSCDGGIDGSGGAGLSPEVPPVAAVGPRPAWVAGVTRAWGLAGAEPSWELAARVVAALARHCELDPTAKSSDDAADTLAAFLLDSHRGPDYCFAGAAVLLLRELGFDSRLAGGLYLSGERRDPRSRKLVAAVDDAHFWAEVRDAAGQWVPVEATPGYAVRPPVVPWWMPARDAVMAALGWAVARPVPVAAAAGLTMLGVILAASLWRPAAGLLATLLWWFAMAVAPGRQFPTTWRLLERRAWLAGSPRPPSVTPREWYLGLARPREPTAVASLSGFIAAFEERVYGPAAPSGDEPSARGIPLALARDVTCASLRGQSAHRASAGLLGRPISLVEFSAWRHS